MDATTGTYFSIRFVAELDEVEVVPLPLAEVEGETMVLVPPELNTLT